MWGALVPTPPHPHCHAGTKRARETSGQTSCLTPRFLPPKMAFFLILLLHPCLPQTSLRTEKQPTSRSPAAQRTLCCPKPSGCWPLPGAPLRLAAPHPAPSRLQGQGQPQGSPPRTRSCPGCEMPRLPRASSEELFCPPSPGAGRAVPLRTGCVKPIRKCRHISTGQLATVTSGGSVGTTGWHYLTCPFPRKHRRGTEEPMYLSPPPGTAESPP